MSPFSVSGSNSKCVLTLTKSKHEHDSKLNGYTEKAKYLRNTRSLINNLFKKIVNDYVEINTSSPKKIKIDLVEEVQNEKK